MPYRSLLCTYLKLMLLHGAWPWVKTLAMFQKYGRQVKNATIVALFGILLMGMSYGLLKGYPFPLPSDASVWVRLKFAASAILGVIGFFILCILPCSIHQSYGQLNNSDPGMLDHAFKIEETKQVLLEKAYLDTKLKKAKHQGRSPRKRL